MAARWPRCVPWEASPFSSKRWTQHWQLPQSLVYHGESVLLRTVDAKRMVTSSLERVRELLRSAEKRESVLSTVPASALLLQTCGQDASTCAWNWSRRSSSVNIPHDAACMQLPVFLSLQGSACRLGSTGCSPPCLTSREGGMQGKTSDRNDSAGAAARKMKPDSRGPLKAV